MKTRTGMLAGVICAGVCFLFFLTGCRTDVDAYADYDYYYYPAWGIYYYPVGGIYYWYDDDDYAWHSGKRVPPKYNFQPQGGQPLRLHTRQPWTEHPPQTIHPPSTLQHPNMAPPPTQPPPRPHGGMLRDEGVGPVGPPLR